MLAIRDMERAGIDVITDGEIRRESYSNRFATGARGDRQRQSGAHATSPGARRRCRAWWARSAAGGGGTARRAVPAPQHRPRTKITLPGPFTMAQQAENEFYQDEEELVMDYAAAVNEELRELKAAGADVIQFDEPWLRTDRRRQRFGMQAINRALARH